MLYSPGVAATARVYDCVALQENRSSGGRGADQGYDGWWFRRGLAERGIADGIMACNYRQRRLTADHRDRNREIARLRAPIERTIAIMKRWYGYRRVRYRNLGRNSLQLQFLAMAMNLRRALVLTG